MIKLEDFEIRQGKAEDASSLYTLQSTYLIMEAWSKRTIEKDLNNNDRLYFVALYQREIVGFISGSYIFNSSDLMQIVVEVAYRGLGLGKKLLQTMVDYLDERGVHKMILEVRESNSARTFYEKCGFMEISRRQKYYHTEDAIVYMKMW